MRPSRALLTTAVLTAGLGLVLAAAPQLPLPALASDDDPGAEGWLGVRLQELTPELRESLHVDRRVNGVLVSDVVEGSPAEAAGLQAEDVITEIQGTRISTVDEAVDAVKGLPPGEKVLVTINRNGRSRAMTAVLGDREEARSQGRYDEDVRRYYGQPPEPPRPPRPPRAPQAPEAPRPPHPPLPPRPPHVEIQRLSGGYLGVQTYPLNDQLAEYFGVPEGQGVLVLEVVENSPAEAAGLRAGDVILSVGDTEIDSPRDLRRAIRHMDPESTVSIKVSRKGEIRTLDATLGDAKDMSEWMGPWGDHARVLADLGELDIQLPDLDIQLPDLDGLLENLPDLEDLPQIEWHGHGDGPHIYYYEGDGTEWREIDEEVREALRESFEAAREQMERVRVQVREVQQEKLQQLREQLDSLRERERTLDRERIAPGRSGTAGTI